ncbi:6-phosphogluconolactonase [bacterium]|nr:6-phosphogluconolactonase [bacterium]MBU1993538.1 6-phosphogluconolactonase [bacterium]
MKNNFEFYTFESSELLVRALCKRIVANLAGAIAKKGHAYLAVSGGSTPKKLFEELSMSDLDWKKVDVTLVDERWVEPSHPQSNERLVHEHLLQNKAKFAHFIPLKNIVSNANDGIEISQNRLKKIDNFDVVVLGMGNDAHTASFFPHAKELELALDTDALCCASTASVEPKERITLTRSFLLSATSLILHIEGQVKKEVFEKASRSDDYKEMPIIAMMQQVKPKLEVYYA